VRDIATSRQREEAVSTNDPVDPSNLELTEEVIQLNRVAKVVKGGRRFSFSALVVVGDKNGHVGLGFGKANEVPESIQKGMQNAKKALVRVPRVGRTLPYKVEGVFGAAKVMLKPASEGTGIIAGPAVRSVLELAGIQDVLTKNLGSKNVINILKAVMEGLKSIRDAEESLRLRGKNLEEIMGKRRAQGLRESSRVALLASETTTQADEEQGAGAMRAGDALVVAKTEESTGENQAQAQQTEGTPAQDTPEGEGGPPAPAPLADS